MANKRQGVALDESEDATNSQLKTPHSKLQGVQGLEHFTPLGYFDYGQCPMHRTNFSEQKHGAVVQVTKKELMKLIQYWNK
ncbi:hypothetical protein [Prevotella sp. P6B4]|uniref:hypothetical protein n=1 Tax=Prevotella sp. P6B4 TaxID=1410614 RepID=UPI000A8536A8|nr:hypothetical protein [Prevotella sp. P6B4]